jgi:hypothetical protein
VPTRMMLSMKRLVALKDLVSPIRMTVHVVLAGWTTVPLCVRGLERVQLHADLVASRGERAPRVSLIARSGRVPTETETAGVSPIISRKDWRFDW